MIEEYGTLSEEELLQEILNQLEESPEIDSSDLDFKYVEDKLKISGTLQNEDELEVLIAILEDYVDPKDYQCDVELLEEGLDSALGKNRRPARAADAADEDDDDEFDDEYDDDGLEEVDEDDADFEEEEEEEEEEGGGGGGSDKW